ncbi:MAG: SusC/RagA family TonB-linked outer membrane protein, partial [Sphingobacteriaceae bacterium]
MLYCYTKKCFTGIIVLMLMLAKTSLGAIQDTTAKASTNPADVVTGTVVDDDNRPLSNVKVHIKGDTVSSATDIEGDFSIKASVGNVLVLSYPNHYVKEVKVKSAGEQLNVTLIQSYLQKRDTVDVLYGNRSASSLLGSVSTIYTNQLTTTPASMYVYALPGQLAGLYTSQSSGFTTNGNQNPLTEFFGSAPTVVSLHGVIPNDNTQISLQVRGQGVTTVIDGIQREISSIDPESIESISILKDALSTVLLGIKGSKPILLVTTKKPELGDPKISFTAATGVQQSMGLPTKNVLSAYQYAYLFNEAAVADGIAPRYSVDDIQKYKDQSSPFTHPDINWYETLLKKSAPMSTYKLNVSGGSNVARYTIGLNYFNQGGIFKEAANVPYETSNNLSRYMLNSNISVNVTKNLVVDLQMFGRIQEVRDPGRGYSGILSSLARTPNNAYAPINPDGSFGASNFGSPFNDNLLSRAQYSGYTVTKVNDVFANLNLNYNMDSFLQGLKFTARGNVAIQSQIYLDRSLANATFVYIPTDDGQGRYTSATSSASQSNSFVNVLSSRYSFAQAALSYDHAFGKNNVSAQLMYDMSSLAVSYDLEATTQNRALKLGYNWDEKYFIEGVVNYSGYNRYAPGNQNGWFYAGGLGWHMGKESFMKDLSWIDSWKWRVSYGRTGNNNVGYYVYKQTYTTGGLDVPSYPQGITHNTTNANGNGAAENPIANPNISWEKADKLDIGADISAFKGHLQITADYYNDKYSDLLTQRGTSITILGAAYPAENVGINRYYGGELTLTYKGNIHDFNYFITGNGSIAASKRVFFDEQRQPDGSLLRTGKPVNGIFGYNYIGFMTPEDIQNGTATIAGYTAQPGDLKFEDKDDNGVIDQYDQKLIGNKKALVFYGLSFGFNYKAFSFSAIIQGVTNRTVNIRNGIYNGFEGSNFGFGTPAAPYGQAYDNITNRWTPETAGSAIYPRLSLSQIANYNPFVGIGGTNTTINSSFYLKSGNYVRLKNVEVGYSLPLSWLRKVKLSGVRLFANGENLFTIAGFRQYDGWDPEVNGLSFYPIQRV